jgi:hypothetical protein
LRAHRALTQGIAAERALAEHIRDKILPKVDAHDKRVLKARRKEYERVAALQAAEERPSRTRRQTKVVNYRDLDEGVDYDSDEPRRGSRRAAAPVEPARPVIPGERRSARQRGRPVYDEDDYEDGPGSGAPASPAGNGNGNGNREAGPGGDEEGGSGSGSGSEWEDGAANGHNGSAVEPIEVDSD